MPVALITGISGQTGSYLAEDLVKRGWVVHGTTLGDTGSKSVSRHAVLHRVDLSELNQVEMCVQEVRPDVLFNLAAISSVAESWKNPLKTKVVNDLAVTSMLEEIQKLNHETGKVHKFVQASSAEIFGSPSQVPQTEKTAIAPTNPYGISKAAAHLTCGIYRDTGVWASSCILYNHESVRRPLNFVTRKITNSVARIALGKQEKLTLGNLDIYRDWGWAPDYARAMFLVSDTDAPDDYIVSTGISHSLRELLSISFDAAGIHDWEHLVVTSEEFLRPTDTRTQLGDSTKLGKKLGWHPSIKFSEMITLMTEHDLELEKN